jgi:hypothetical protein
VREVDDHPEAVHLGHDLAAEVAEPAKRGLVGRRVRPGHVLVVGEREVADTEPVVGPEHPQGTVDLVTALRSEERGDPTRLPRPLDLGGGGRKDQPVGVRRDHAVGRIDLLEGRRNRLVPECRRYEHRPELCAHPAGRQARQVGVDAPVLAYGDVEVREVVAVQVAHGPQQVVVTIGHRVSAEHGCYIGHVDHHRRPRRRNAS